MRGIKALHIVPSGYWDDITYSHITNLEKTFTLLPHALAKSHCQILWDSALYCHLEIKLSDYINNTAIRRHFDTKDIFIHMFVEI